MSKLLALATYFTLVGIIGITGCGYSVQASPSMITGSIEVMPSAVTLSPNQSFQLAAVKIVGTDSGIDDITQTATWQSSSASGVTVAKGQVTCKHAGGYTVTVATLSLSQSAAITCISPNPLPPPTPSSPPVAPTPPTPPAAPASPTPPAPQMTAVVIPDIPIIVRSDAPHTLKAQGTYADETTLDVTSQATWKGDNVARVSSTGTVYCNTGGKAVLTATIGSYVATASTQCIMKQIAGPVGLVEHSLNFYGPFPSWLNVKDFGVKGDGNTNDTVAMQTAITAAIAQSKTLYVPDGTYLMLGKLRVVKSDGLTIVGEDPRKTTFIWRGAVDDTLIGYEGSTHFRLRRVSLDCKNLAKNGIQIDFTQTNGELYPTYNSIEDLKISHCDTGIKPGFAGETTISRVHFDQDNYGLNTASWNAMNINVVDSLFTDNGVGVSNYALAGGFNISNSVFVRSKVADVQMGNPNTISVRHNLTVGSKSFFHADPISLGAAVTIEGNVIVDTTDVPIVYGNQGSVTLLDNTFSMTDNPQRPVFLAANYAPTFLFAVGNRYTAATPYVAQSGSYLTVNSFDEAPEAAITGSSWQVPSEVYIPPASSKPVIEAKAGGTSEDIQNAINDAAPVPGGATVHLSASSYTINTSVDVPDAPGLSIVGDGLNTDLRPSAMLLGTVMRTQGAVELQDMFISASPGSSSLQVLVNDQPSTRVFCELCTTVNTRQAASVSGIDHASITTQASTLNGDRGIVLSGGSNQANGKQTLGKVDAFMTTSDVYTINHGGHFLISDGWHDGNQSAMQAIVSDNSVVTQQGSTIYAASPKAFQAVGFSGQMSLVGDQIFSTISADPASTGNISILGSNTGNTNTQLDASGSGVSITKATNTIATPSGVGSITDTPSSTADVERSLSQTRTEFVTPREQLAAPSTFVRIHHVMSGDGAVGMSFSSNRSATGAAMYSILDPSGRNASASCSTGTHSLDGAWTLVAGGDGFYGLLQAGAYLTNTIDATNGVQALDTTATMMDAGQRWLVKPAGNGLFHIVNRADGSLITRTQSGCATLSAAADQPSQEWMVAAK